jgi:hypothetical protein
VENQVASVQGSAVDRVDLDRRRALRRLGLAAGIAYAAPVILHLDREAKAMMASTPCPPPDGNCGNNPAACTC